MTLDELDKFIGLVIARGILGQRGLPVESCVIQPGCQKFVGYNLGVKSLWDTTWVSKVCGIQPGCGKFGGYNMC